MSLTVVQVVAVAAIAGMALGQAALADEAIPFEQVPILVKEALKARWPNAESLSARVDGEDQKHYYLKFTLAGRPMSAHYSEEGKLLQSVESIKAADVPSGIRDVVNNRYPGALICQIKRITQGGGPAARVQYHFKTQTEDERRAFVFTAAGKLISELLEEDSDDNTD